jgi:hypothetical protein
VWRTSLRRSLCLASGCLYLTEDKEVVACGDDTGSLHAETPRKIRIEIMVELSSHRER